MSGSSSRTGAVKILRQMTKRNRPSLVGLGICLLLLGCAIFAPLLVPYDPTDLNMRGKLAAPSGQHWFGTDEMGRDILSRIIIGSRVSLQVLALVLVFSLLIGVPLGLLAGYLGGWVDEVIMRITDIFLAFPPLVLAMAIAAALGPSLTNATIAIVLVWWPSYARLVRGQALAIKDGLYVEAARALGARNLQILIDHILPNSVTPIIIKATLDGGRIILFAASLSFIGLGAQPPTPEWGAMISAGRGFLLNEWWVPFFPGLAIFLTITGLNLFGDGLRDALDPRFEG